MAHRLHPTWLPAGSIHRYLDDNHRIARRLVGRRLHSAARRLELPPEDDPGLGHGPVLLTSHDGERWQIDVDESKANIVFLHTHGKSETDPGGDGHTKKDLIAESAPDHPLRRLPALPITSVDVVSREPEPGVPDSFAMCGLRLTTTDGSRIYLGTHLTDLMIPEVAVLTPDEVDPLLHHTPL